MQSCEVGFTHIGFDDFAFAIDHIGGGRNLDILEGFRNIAVHIQRHIKWQLAGFRKIHHVIGAVVAHGHGNGSKALVFELVVGVDNVWHFFHASGATGCPKVHKHHLALVIGRCNGLALNGDVIHLRCFVAPAGGQHADHCKG